MIKKINFLYLFVALCGSLLMASCSEDKETATPAVFPALQEKSAAANTELEYTFTASQAWKLNSPLIWCSFLVEDEKVSTVYGEAGEQTVKLFISDGGSEFDQEDEVALTMTMGGETQVVLTVKRSPETMKLALFDAEGNEISSTEAIVLEYGDSLRLSGKGNFTWAITGSPEFINFPGAISGAANREVKLSAGLTAGFSKNATEGVIYLGSQADPKMYAYSVSYDGIPADKIEFNINDVERNRYEFSADGSEYYYIYQGETLKSYSAPLNFETVVRNDDYTVLYIEDNSRWGCTVLNQWNRWFNVADDGQGNLKLTVEENTTTDIRQGYLMVLPKVVNDLYKDNFYDDMFDENRYGDWKFTLKEEVEQYVALPIKQQFVAPEVGFTAMYNGVELELMKYSDVAGNPLPEYGTDNVWILSLNNQAYERITVQPKGVGVWQRISVDTYWNSIDTVWDDVYVSVGYDPEYKPLVSILNITPKVSGMSREQMVITVMDDLGEPTGYVLVEQW